MYILKYTQMLFTCGSVVLIAGESETMKKSLPFQRNTYACLNNDAIDEILESD